MKLLLPNIKKVEDLTVIIKYEIVTDYLKKVEDLTSNNKI